MDNIRIKLAFLIPALVIGMNVNAMDRALTSAASGMLAQQANIDRISSDLANINTDGYKRSRNQFQDLMYETIKAPGTKLGANSITPIGVQRGMGVRVAGQSKIFEQGPARMTYRPYDLLIEGEGFFVVQTAEGDIRYTRQGIFRTRADGVLVTATGYVLIPQVTVPSTTVKVTVAHNGEIIATMPNLNDITLGQIQLTIFQNPEGLLALGNSVYAITAASGDPITGIPAENGMGVIQQGALEGSNVNIANSMVEMITTQRAYEMNTKVMKTADEMMQSTVNIR